MYKCTVHALRLPLARRARSNVITDQLRDAQFCSYHGRTSTSGVGAPGRTTSYM